MINFENLKTLPNEIIDLVFEHLIITIGFYRAVRLRPVNRFFDASIIRALYVRSVLDIHDPDTPYLAEKIPQKFMGIVYTQPVRPREHPVILAYKNIVRSICNTLDTFYEVKGAHAQDERRRTVAGGLIYLAKADQLDLADEVLQARNLLCAAVLVGDVEVIKTILKTQPHGYDREGALDWTAVFLPPITQAATAGHLEVVKLLLDWVGDTPDDHEKRWMVDRSDQAKTRTWKYGGDYWWRDLHDECSGINAFSNAVRRGHTSIVQLFLEEQHRLRPDDFGYLQALFAGATAGRPDLIHLLLQFMGISLSDYRDVAMRLVWFATRARQTETLAWLADWGVDVLGDFGMQPAEVRRALFIATTNGDVPTIRFLLNRGENVKGHDNHPAAAALHQAVIRGHEEAVKLLLHHGANPKEALIVAAHGGQVRLVKYLLNKYPSLVWLPLQPDLEPGGFSVARNALEMAIGGCHLSTITALVQAGVGLNFGRDFAGGSQYFHAKFNAVWDILDGVEPGDKGALPMNLAKRTGRQWVVDHLIFLGAEDTAETFLPRPRSMRPQDPMCRDQIVMTERTWEWASKY
jgi:ankyrin repeat protein